MRAQVVRRLLQWSKLRHWPQGCPRWQNGTAVKGRPLYGPWSTNCPQQKPVEEAQVACGRPTPAFWNFLASATLDSGAYTASLETTVEISVAQSY